jgi:flagellar operon protein
MNRVTGVGFGNVPKEIPPSRGKTRPDGLFDGCLKKACIERDLRISGHAEERIKQRNIEIGVEDLEKISKAMRLVAEKGGAKPAIFCRDLVFIADARDRAIITAMSSGDRDERILTGIDSAVVI